jgi:hypothetical protein
VKKQAFSTNIEKENFTRNPHRKEKGKKPLQSKEKRSVPLGNATELADFTDQKNSCLYSLKSKRI